MRNRFAGNCKDCRRRVEVGDGFFERQPGRWAVRCMECVAAGKQAAGKPLTPPQAAALKAKEAANG